MNCKKRINLWSGPRNVSTALMYSFAQRTDTRVVDEPFYAHYLKKTGAEHPGREKVLASQPGSPSRVLDNLLADEDRGKADLLFIKNMAHHMVQMDSELPTLLDQFEHIFLIRNPRDMLQSLVKTLPFPTLRDTAYKRQYELFQAVRLQGSPLHVVDSRELLENPSLVLSNLCSRLGIDFQQAMLNWKPGPISEDGVWAEYWYEHVHQSAGFEPYKPKKESIPKRLQPLYEECMPYYSKMLAHTIIT